MNLAKKQTITHFTEIDEEHLNSTVSLIYLNIRSLRRNFTSLLVRINKIIKKIKLIILVETNINNIENSLYNIPGFNSIFLNREGKGGGIAIYIKENIDYVQISLNSNSFEIMQIDVKINNHITSLLSVYRPPDKKVS